MTSLRFRLLLGLILLVQSASGQGQNPCHGASIKNSPASSCDVVTLPAGFCSACQFGGYNAWGQYNDCTRTMNIDFADTTCTAALQDYKNLNTCDTVRGNAVDTFLQTMGTDDNARQILDFYYYAICEEGCDCIPQDHADRNRPVVDIHRGNCQAHAYYDICKVLPNIKLIKGEGTDTPAGLPNACPLVNSWFNSPASHGWLQNGNTTVHPDLQVFFNRLTEAEELATNLPFFQSCIDLELAQNRITVATQPTDAPATQTAGQFVEDIVFKHDVLETAVEWEARLGEHDILRGADGEVRNYLDHYGVTIPEAHNLVLTGENTFDPDASSMLNIPVDCTKRDDLFRIKFAGVGKNTDKIKNKFCSWFIDNNEKFCPLVDRMSGRSVIDPTTGDTIRPRIWQTCHQECEDYTHCKDKLLE